MSRTCCGVVHDVRARRTQHPKPQPWLVRKLSVVLTVLILAYATYVYAARFCRDMISNSTRALGSRPTGVVFLVVFALLLLLLSWCYFMVITTSPGDASLYTQKTSKPGHDHNDRSSTLNSSDVRGTSYELTSPTPHHPPTQPSSLGSGKSRAVASQVSVAASSVAKLDRPSYSQPSSRGVEEARPVVTPDSPDGSNPAAPTHANSAHQTIPPRPPPMFARRPTTTPVLLPEYRYCARCQIVKPSRAHHCRACGTCILKYDHHCPWIGQCVGAFNQKYFVNFLLWATMFCFWTFSTLLGFNVRPRRNPGAVVDPQQIVVIALSGLFSLFCSLILMSQVHLILLNQTTVESLNFRSMRDREQDALSGMHRWYQCCAKRRKRGEWDKEWGRIGIEGNLWWLGSHNANWVAVMGRNVWWWILPVGRHTGDGINYPTNPRFDGAGRWMQRKEWPSELR